MKIPSAYEFIFGNSSFPILKINNICQILFCINKVMHNFNIRQNSFIRKEFHWKYLRSFTGHINVVTILLSFILIYTSGNSYCYKIWTSTISFTLFIGVIGLFCSFFILLSNLVHVVWWHLAPYRLTRASFQVIS